MNKVIVIDAGHGGRDPGAVGKHIRESDMALDIANRVRALFLQLGRIVHMTREADLPVSLPERASLANRLKADIFVSIHINAHRDPNVSGVEVFSFPGSTKGARLRNAVYMEIMRLFPTWRGRGTKEANFYVLRKSEMPACLVECGFISNVVDEQELQNPNVRQKFAEGIVAGIEAYLL